MKYHTLFTLLCYLSPLGTLAAESIEMQVRQTLAKLWNHEVDFAITPISGGLTNDNFKIDLSEQTFFLRAARLNNRLLGSSMQHEWEILSLLADTSIAPKPYFYMTQDKLLALEYLDTHGHKFNLYDPDTCAQLCRLVYTLHHLPITFPSEFCPFACIHQYAETAQQYGIAIPSTFITEIVPALPHIQQELTELMTVEKTPAHLDLNEANILTDGKRLWLVDWEYGAMADPYFDLATLASVSFLTHEQTDKLLSYYCQHAEPTAQERRYLFLMRLLADVRWALWCYLQDTLSPIEAPFRTYGDLYLECALNSLTTQVQHY